MRLSIFSKKMFNTRPTGKEINLNALELNDIKQGIFSTVPFAGQALKKMIEDYEFETVLDIGSGAGLHSDVFLKFGKTVTSLDFGKSVYYEQRSKKHYGILGDYLTTPFKSKFDGIWASHVLEHQPNVNLFLKKIHYDLKEGGILAITVPPLKNDIVGGHLSIWNAGLLIYNLVFAGFDCKNISVLKYGYNISIILKKKSITKFPELAYDKGDIDLLKSYFPPNLSEPFDGDILELNWFKKD